MLKACFCTSSGVPVGAPAGAPAVGGNSSEASSLLTPATAVASPGPASVETSGANLTETGLVGAPSADVASPPGPALGTPVNSSAGAASDAPVAAPKDGAWRLFGMAVSNLTAAAGDNASASSPAVAAAVLLAPAEAPIAGLLNAAPVADPPSPDAAGLVAAGVLSAAADAVLAPTPEPLLGDAALVDAGAAAGPVAGPVDGPVAGFLATGTPTAGQPALAAAADAAGPVAAGSSASLAGAAAPVPMSDLVGDLVLTGVNVAQYLSAGGPAGIVAVIESYLNASGIAFSEVRTGAYQVSIPQSRGPKPGLSGQYTEFLPEGLGSCLESGDRIHNRVQIKSILCFVIVSTISFAATYHEWRSYGYFLFLE